MVYGLVMLGGTAPVPLYAFWGPKFGFGAFTTTAVFAVYALGTVVSLVFFAAISDRAGRRPMLVAALAAAMISTVLFLIAHNVATLLAARFAFGLATGVFTATATAALGELERERDDAVGHRAAMVATAANAGGLGFGALFAGVVAQTSSDPTHVVFWIYLVALAPATLAVLWTPETVLAPSRPSLTLRQPVLPASPDGRREFLTAATTVFAAFAVAGVFSSLVPNFLRTDLHVANHAVIGGVEALFFLAALIAQALATEGLLSSPTVAPLGLAVGVIAFQGGLLTRSFPLFCVGTIMAGAAFGLVLRRGVAAAHALAEPSRRADLLATFFLFAYAGNIIPTITMGALEQRLSTDAATSLLAAFVTILAVLATFSRNGAPSRKKISL